MPAVFDPDGCLVEPIDPITPDAPGWVPADPAPTPLDPVPPIYDFPAFPALPPVGGVCPDVRFAFRLEDLPAGSPPASAVETDLDPGGCSGTITLVVGLPRRQAAGPAGPPGTSGPKGYRGPPGPPGRRPRCHNECDDPVSSSSGSLGSGSSSATPPDETPITCAECPDTSLPATVTATTSGAVAPCTSANGLTYELVRSGLAGSYEWTASFTAAATSNLMRLKCSGGNWNLSVVTSPPGCSAAGIAYLATGTCSPLAMAFVMDACIFCASAAPGATITVTVTP